MSFLNQIRRGLTRRTSDEPGLAGNNILAEISRDRNILTDAGLPIEVEGAEKASRTLAEIYTVETVDLKTVKRLGVTAPEEAPKAEPKPADGVLDQEPQLELDLGDPYRGWMESFVLTEPLTVLGLSAHAQRCLQQVGKTALKDIIGIHFEDFLLFKGLGQTHLNEVKEKLSAYLKGRNLSRPRRIDAVALIRGQASFLPKVDLALLFKRFGCEEFIQLSPGEKHELESLDKNAVTRRGDAALKALGEKKGIIDALKRVEIVYVIPWVQQRGRVATAIEIKERWERLICFPESARKLLNFLEALAGDLLKLGGLIPVQENLYATDKEAKALALSALKIAKSYYYKPQMSYPLGLLKELVLKELCLFWVALDARILERVLIGSGEFVRFIDKGAAYAALIIY